ncbi:hypothetical protein X741_30315 [Mesorhizobium sp. LNHC229A00]|nr:hypothetical protein X741_30315 [Mesorhizobium sp. LNHC229A00]
MVDKTGSMPLIPGELSLIFPECIIASNPRVRLVLTIGINDAYYSTASNIIWA